MRSETKNGIQFTISGDSSIVDDLVKLLPAGAEQRSLILLNQKTGMFSVIPIPLGESFTFYTHNGNTVKEVGILDGDVTDKMSAIAVDDLLQSQRRAKSLAAKERVVKNKNFTKEVKERIDKFFATIPETERIRANLIFKKLDAINLTNQLEVVVGIEDSCKVDPQVWKEIFSWFETNVLKAPKTVSEAPSFQMLRRAFISTATKFFSTKRKIGANSLDTIKEQDTFDWTAYVTEK